MKSFVTYLLKYYGIFFFILFVFWGCESVTESQQPQLIIYNGFYQKIDIKNNKIRYLVKFDYVSRGVDCCIGGYGMNWDSLSTGLIYYSEKYLPANKIFTENDTISILSEINSLPLIKMQGYTPETRKEYDYLYAEYRLNKK
jgi:hypothetical protein